jgi:GntR family transcriptional repressor for pyruvate dehydrogenase complex
VIKKIVRDGVADQVYNQLKENVVQGVWRPGDRIPSENQLASLFGVSRASVRMAINKMITLGLLESRVGDGTYVKAFTPGVYINELVPLVLKPEDQIEIMEFRRALETEALKLAVTRASDEEIRELEELNTRARTALKNRDQETYFKEDLQFHMHIFRASKNGILVKTVETLGHVLFPHFYSITRDFLATSEVPSDETDKHTIIVEALKRRDPKTCVRAYRKLTEDLIAMYHLIQGKKIAAVGKQEKDGTSADREPRSKAPRRFGKPRMPGKDEG